MRFDPANPQMMSERAQAAIMLARIYQQGLAVPADPGQARHWYEKAADFGYVPALDILGRGWTAGTFGTTNRDKGLAYLKDAAQAGYAPAQYRLGKLYYTGADGSTRDTRLAGTYFYEGGLVGKDAKTARGWFEAAAHQGQPDAMFSLGAMLSKGEGGPSDLAMAYVWLSLAGRAGHDDAPAALRTIGPRLSAQDRARADAVLKPAPKS